MKPEIKIRPARIRDIQKLYNMAKEDLGKYNWFNKRSLAKNIREEPGLCFVVEYGKSFAGAFSFRQEWKPVVWAWLGFIRKELRQKGIGSMFENTLSKKLKKMGYKIIYTEVDEDNIIALNWCRKNNYRRVCRFPDWFGKVSMV